MAITEPTSVRIPTAVPNRSPNWLLLLLHDMRYGLRSAPRTPFPVVMALFLPLFFNVMFNLMQRDEVVAGIPGVNFTTATIIVFVVTTSGYFNMAVGITVAREKGVLKRIRQTPMPKALHLTARIGVLTVMSAASVTLMLAVSTLAFGLRMRPLAIVGLVLVFVVASFTSSVLGLALTRAIPTVEAGVVVGTATLFPLLFISGVFFPIDGMPGPVQTVIDYLPFAPMAELVRGVFDPASSGLAIAPLPLAIVAGWGVIGLLLTVRTMRWEPRR
jgi:ABC-2 type transport system permease protein